MLKKNGVGVKLVFAFILVTVMSVSLQILLLSQSIAKITTADALAYLTEISSHYATESKDFLEDGLELATQLNSAFEGLQEFKKVQKVPVDREIAISILESMHDSSPWANGLWTCWESNTFDGQDIDYVNKPGHDQTGRFVPLSYTIDGRNGVTPLVDYDKIGVGNYYLLSYNTQQEIVVEPYNYVYPNGGSILMTSMAVPIKIDGKVVGVSGVDIGLSYFKQQMSSIRPMDSGIIMLISPGLQIVGHSDPRMVGKMLNDTPYAVFIPEISITETSGQPIVEVINDKSIVGQEDVAVAIIPFAPGNTDQNWAVATIVPVSRVLQTTNILMDSSLRMGFVTLGLAIIIGLLAVKVVNNYTRDLRKLQTSQTELDVAEKSSYVKSIFLANISHEIRTPLNAIMGLLYLIMQNKVNDAQREYLTKIEDAAKALLHIINDILDFSKIEAGKLDLENSMFHLTDILQNVTDLASSHTWEKGLELIVNVSPNTPIRLIGDPRRLEQIINNLLNNAIKFTSKGQVTLKVETELNIHQEVTLRFLVHDTGIGLTSKQVTILFSAFTQADTSTTKRYGGTGLGLVICKRLVEMMGGTIWAESEYGCGSTFGFTAKFGLQDTPPASKLPAGIGDQKQPDQETATQRQKNQGILMVKDFSGARILLAEDNEVNQLVASRIMEGAGLKVDIANNGRQAVDMVKTGQYELILMDIQMPVMDGLTATSEIRSMPEFENLPILAMTANAMFSDREASIKAGMNDHISKPIDIHELFAALAKWLEIKRKSSTK